MLSDYCWKVRTYREDKATYDFFFKFCLFQRLWLNWNAILLRIYSIKMQILLWFEYEEFVDALWDVKMEVCKFVALLASVTVGNT